MPTHNDLAPGTQESYRSFATNAVGTSYGNCVQFTTITAPPPSSPPSPTDTTATISGTVTDSTGTPLANGYLVLDDGSNNGEDVIQLDANGNYNEGNLPSIPYGVYVFDVNGNQYEADYSEGGIVHLIYPQWGTNTINFSEGAPLEYTNPSLAAGVSSSNMAIGNLELENQLTNQNLAQKINDDLSLNKINSAQAATGQTYQYFNPLTFARSLENYLWSWRDPYPITMETTRILNCHSEKSVV